MPRYPVAPKGVLFLFKVSKMNNFNYDLFQFSKMPNFNYDLFKVSKITYFNYDLFKSQQNVCFFMVKTTINFKFSIHREWLILLVN